MEMMRRKGLLSELVTTSDNGETILRIPKNQSIEQFRMAYPNYIEEFFESQKINKSQDLDTSGTSTQTLIVAPHPDSETERRNSSPQAIRDDINKKFPPEAIIYDVDSQSYYEGRSPPSDIIAEVLLPEESLDHQVSDNSLPDLKTSANTHGAETIVPLVTDDVRTKNSSGPIVPNNIIITDSNPFFIKQLLETVPDMPLSDIIRRVDTMEEDDTEKSADEAETSYLNTSLRLGSRDLYNMTISEFFNVEENGLPTGYDVPPNATVEDVRPLFGRLASDSLKMLEQFEGSKENLDFAFEVFSNAKKHFEDYEEIGESEIISNDQPGSESNVNQEVSQFEEQESIQSNRSKLPLPSEEAVPTFDLISDRDLVNENASSALPTISIQGEITRAETLEETESTTINPEVLTQFTEEGLTNEHIRKLRSPFAFENFIKAPGEPQSKLREFQGFPNIIELVTDKPTEDKELHIPSETLFAQEKEDIERTQTISENDSHPFLEVIYPKHFFIPHKAKSVESDEETDHFDFDYNDLGNFNDPYGQDLAFSDGTYF